MQAQQEKRATVQVLEETTEVPEEHVNKFPDLNPDEVDKRASVRLKLTNFGAIRNEPGKLYSEEFPLMGRTWRFLVFPQGNNSPEAFSLYLEHTGPQLPPGHGLCIKLVLALVCEDPAASVHRETQHRYSRTDSDWGFTVFVKKALFYSEEKGKRFLLDDAVTVVVTMFLMHDEYGTLWNNFKDYDSKAMTGHVGLKNQGATCYMNSILQAWFFTPVFRKAVYQIPVAAEDPTKNVTLALQRVFYNLQHSNHPVSTTDLTVSFGWDSIDSFMQHDVQEFNRVLLDSLENKMKGTSVEGTINRIIEGKYKTYIKCIDVDYESSRVETFCDVQLNVKGLRTLEDSFRDYIQVETLDDDNKYMAEGYGLQAARKGVIFESFPPVLHMQLKRFEYDFMRDANVKINDRHEFPLTIDLRPYMSDPSTREPQIYHLHGVLVHAGDTHGGHYCAFIRPKPHGEWFKFDDDRVTRCPSREAMEDNFGADPDPAGDGMMPAKPTTRFMRRHTNAYMLVYIREQELHDVLCPVEESDIPVALRERFEQERVEEDQRRKEREEQHLMMTVRVMTDAQIAANKGLDLTAAVADDATDTDAAMHAFKVKTDMLMSEFRPLVAQKLGVQQPQRLRFWTIIRRQNVTFRPEVAVTDEEDEQTLGAILRGNKSMNELQFYVETSPNTTPDKNGHYFPPLAHNDILLFFKAYDPDAALMTYVGSAVVKSSERPLDLVDKLNALAGFPPKTQLRVWEEISSLVIEEVKLKTSFRNADMKTGDILCFMKDAPAEHLATLKLPTPKDYFSFIVRRVIVRFRPRNAPKDAAQEVPLELERTMTYDEVAAALGAKIGHSGDSIRFTQYSSYYEGPAKQELRRELVKNLGEMLARTANAPDLLYYEKLEMTLAELENKVVLPVYIMNAHMHPEGPHTIMVEKVDTAGAIIEAMKKKQEQLRKEKPAKGGDDTATSSPVSSSDAMVVDAPSIESVTSSTGDAIPVDAVEPPQEGAVDAMQVDPPAVEYRLVEVSGHRHIRVVPETEPVRTLRPMYDEFYVQIVPEFERTMQPGDQKVLVAHFNRDPYSNFGAPFYFIVKKDEKVVDTRKRMQKLLNLGDKEWSKYKMAVVNLLGKHEYLTDDEAILSDREFGSNVFLGLDHVDRSARSSRLYHERTLVIKN